MSWFTRWMKWEREEHTPKLSHVGEALQHCGSIRRTIRDYLEAQKVMNKYSKEIDDLRSTSPVPCEDYYLRKQKSDDAWVKYGVASDQFSVAIIILQTFILPDDTVEVRMDGKVYHVSHKLFTMGYSIEVKEIVQCEEHAPTQ